MNLMAKRKIYFCGSITGGRGDAETYRILIEYLKNFGEVLTEHIAGLDEMGEAHAGDQFIHDRDLEWLESSEVVIAEVTQPSLGVGYELGRAVDLGKSILCLYRPAPGKRLSGMIAGSPGITTVSYETIDQAKSEIERFLLIE